MSAAVLLALGALAAAAPPAAPPGTARPAPPPIVKVVPAPPGAAPVDPARLAAPQRMMLQILPPGTYAKLTGGSVRTIVEAAAAGAFHDGEGPSTADARRKADPHYDERMRIFMDVMFAELEKIMDREEPGIRNAMARAYARRFTVEEMRQLDVFFATPIGRKFALQSVMLMEDPELLAQTMSLHPRMQAQMPRVVEKVMAATAHLPPPPDEEPTS